MGRITTNAVQLSFVYGKAVEAVQKVRCAKCWATDFAMRCFGRETQCYTFPEPDGSGLWAFDVDKARELVGDRIDGVINPDALVQGIGQTEPGHEFCLLRRADKGGVPPFGGPVGIVARMGDGGALIIDGTHRGRLCIAAGVAMPIAVLTAAEFDQVVMFRPPNDLSFVQQREMDRMTALFAGMNADVFFAEMAAVLGHHQLSVLMGSEEQP